MTRLALAAGLAAALALSAGPAAAAPTRAEVMAEIRDLVLWPCTRQELKADGAGRARLLTARVLHNLLHAAELTDAGEMANKIIGSIGLAPKLATLGGRMEWYARMAKACGYEAAGTPDG